jgi:hypothetical protein
MIVVKKFNVYPSAGFGKKRALAQERADALIASCNAIEQLVAALSAGKLAAPDVAGAARKDIRYAPHFVVGRGASEPNTVPYDMKWIERVLIEDGKPSRWLRTALMLLEGKSLGYVGQDTFNNIYNLRPGFSAAQLAKRLARKKLEWEALHSGEIALGVEPL